MQRVDGFEEAEIGVSVGPELHRIIYDYDKCIQILIERDEVSQADAIDYMQHNVVHACVGDSTPIFIEIMESAEIDMYADSMTGP
jgi:hypothetical protein